MSISDRITRTDVAREAGVSKAVVSAVINDRARAGGIAEDTIERVLDAIHELDYSPRAMASAMARGVSDGIGIVGDGMPALRDECLRAARDAGWYAAPSLATDREGLRRERDRGRFDCFIGMPGCGIVDEELCLVAIDRDLPWDCESAADLAIEELPATECLVLHAQHPDATAQRLLALLCADRRCNCVPLALPDARPGESTQALQRACSAEPALDGAAVMAIGDACAWAAAARWPQRLHGDASEPALLPLMVCAAVDLLQWLPGIPYPMADIAQRAVALAAARRDDGAPPELPVPAVLIRP